MTRMSKLDTVYRSLLLSKFFTKGWGKPDHLRRIFELRRKLADRQVAVSFVNPDHPITITKDTIKSNHRVLEGRFVTPFVEYLPDLLPPECETAYFQVVLPTTEPNSPSKTRPICVQYAGTGDHFFWRRRRLMAVPMARERGIASVILENPFYGLRKPKKQVRSSLQQVSDLFVMGACLIMESLVLFNWCEREGFSPIVAHGISMGGHMASLGASVWPKPLGLVPCLSWTSASLTFTKGVMTGSIPWDLLERQYISMDAYKSEVLQLIKAENNAFQAGVEFAQQMDRIAQIENKRWNKIDRNMLGEGQLLKSPKRPEGHQELNSTHEDLVFEAGNILESVRSLDTIELTQPKASPVSDNTPEMPRTLLPKLLRNSDAKSGDAMHREAIHFMRGIMDECTHLKNYDVPYDPSLIYIVVAEHDAYQPRDGIAGLPDIWPGANLRFIKGSGHVSSYLFKQDVFRQAVYDCFDKMLDKYPNYTNVL